MHAMEIVVSISDMKVTNRSKDILVTHARDSCLGLAPTTPSQVAGSSIACCPCPGTGARPW